MVGKFTKIRLILTAVLAFITAAVLSFAVFAATNVRLTGSSFLRAKNRFYLSPFMTARCAIM